MHTNAPPPSQACDLQTCLGRHTYSPDLCSSHMRKLYACCARMYDGGLGEPRESTACPMESVTRRWLKQHADDSDGKPGKK
ncbi:hypothetical protein CALCODRAFT_434256 [Calocera cornea HHB12733]|uniref:Cx9C motif-containing protein 4, mitochondrial n=1 Tax=Calocera cornea HHB12733 TaxID=1353952 RepID=A0A165FYM9_9BASI|nr:hypothetical protein CALCODRAFT_434256 [Calocera cornea HHB12733]